MHVLFLPKWYPGRKDPQLGDFLRKQAMAASTRLRVSVLAVLPVDGAGETHTQELDTQDGPWELRCYYRTSVHPFAPWRKLVNLLRYRHAALRGWRRMVAERGLPHLLHVHILLRPAVLAWWLGRRHGLPYLVGEQSSTFLDGSWRRRSALYKALCRAMCHRAAAITAVSAWLGDELVALGLCRSYHVTPNVVPGLDRPLPPPGEVGHFLMVADLVDRTKNVSGVLRALAAVRRADERARLTLIGDGPDRSRLEALAGTLGLSGHVHFLGRLPNSAVLDHMAHAGVVVINSNVETFSVVTGEALAQGKPVIATRCGGPQAFVTPENGLLVPVGDEEALRKAMQHFMAHVQRYSPEMIRASVGERFGPDTVGSTFETIYRSHLPHERG